LVISYPVGIGLSVLGIFGLLAYSAGFDFRRLVANRASAFQKGIDAADLSVKAEDFFLIVLGVGALLWVVGIFLEHTSLTISLLMLPISEVFAVFFGLFYLRFRGGRRIKGFGDQFEMVLRTLAGALRVGLGFRQALILVSEEVQNPARRELQRVIGRANIGVNLIDALDEMARSVPSSETAMFARVVRVQQQTGGDLAKVLEKLAATIRDRRRIVRKMGALTAQGRMGAAIIGALPVMIGVFVMMTQPDMKDALLHTHIGWGVLGAVLMLETGAIFFLSKIIKLDV